MSGELGGHVGAAQVSRWRTGGSYELTTLLDFEAWLLSVAEPVPYQVSLRLGALEREIEAWISEHQDH
jgi:hypothetical protein